MDISLILLQDTADLIQLISVKELGVAGILLVVIYYFWKRTENLQTKIDEYIKQKDIDAQKYYDLVLKTNEILSESNRIINENNRIMQKLSIFFEKKLE